MKLSSIKIPALTITAIVLSFTFFTGCEDVLDKHNLDSLDEQIWDDEDQATLYINNLYDNNMTDASFGVNSGMTDEYYSAQESFTNLLYGFVGESNIDVVTVLHRTKYELIRRINIAIRGLENSSLDQETKGRLIGQALFFRAYRYWEMVQLYGGIPMVMTVQDPYSDDLNVSRSKTSESIALIVADLDNAIAGLPADWTFDADKGRITSGAAAAFKSRVLLTWASPIFNPNNDQTRWQQAYDAGKEAVTLLSQMTVPRDLYPNFGEIFTTDVLSNPEAIIFKRYSLDAGSDYTHGWENSIRPPSAGGNGGYNPTWELVKAFPMANGKLIGEPGSGYDSTYFWLNRDPRFYKTVVYNGEEWKLTGRSNNIQWCFRSVNESNRVPATGFYCCKASDPSIIRENIGQTNTAWIELRYAEVLLNLAESANELDKISEALDYVRRIRQRAGIEAGSGTYGISESVTKEELREIIMVERQVEFAFENKRYWDMRRRLMFREDLGAYVKKFNGTQRHGFTYTVKSPWGTKITDATSPYYNLLRIDTAYIKGHLDINNAGSYTNYYTAKVKVMESIVNNQTQSINYLPLYDFFAVSSSMLQKSPAVEQTIGWLNGTFDPLAE